jgi:hypothetical protein
MGSAMEFTVEKIQSISCNTHLCHSSTDEDFLKGLHFFHLGAASVPMAWWWWFCLDYSAEVVAAAVARYYYYASGSIASAGFLLLATCLIQASVAQGYPLSQLGA